MILIIASMILLVVFTALGSIHFYWLFGGTWALEKVIPTKEQGGVTFSPSKLATFIVGLGLVTFGLVYLLKSGVLKVQIPSFIDPYVYWFIPSIFLLRAIGDFNYVGLFKKIKYTEFAKADSKLFVPLCVTIGVLGIIIQLVK